MPSFTSPIGRLLAGSVYKANDKDWQGNPLTTKTGPNAGQPRAEYFFAVGIPKGTESHWSQTPWGQLILNAATAGFPNGEPQRPDFSWKIVDGDSQVPNKKNVMPCTKEGYPGNWVISYSSGFAPKVCNADASQMIMEPNAVKLGYFVQVLGDVEANGNPGNPGVYINHKAVALAAYGEEISTGPDLTQAGFGGQPLPAGASATPLAVAGLQAAGLPAQGMPLQPGAPAMAQQPQAQQQMPQAQPMGQQAPQQQLPAIASLPAQGQQPAHVAATGVPVTGMPAQGAVQPPQGMPAQNAGPAAAAQYAPQAGAAQGAQPAQGVAGNVPQQMAPGQQQYLTGQQ